MFNVNVFFLQFLANGTYIDFVLVDTIFGFGTGCKALGRD